LVAIWKEVARLSLVARLSSNSVKAKGTPPPTPCKPAKKGWMKIVEEVDADPEVAYLTVEALFVTL